MSYAAYKGYRLAPDDNGCVDVLTASYEQIGTYPSYAAAKRAVDKFETEDSTSQSDPSNTELRGEIAELLYEKIFDITHMPLESDRILTQAEIVEAIMQLFQAREQQLLTELKAKIAGLEVDIEATEKHIESTGLSGDELERQILNMHIEADDRRDVLNDVTALLEQKLKQTNE